MLMNGWIYFGEMENFTSNSWVQKPDTTTN